MSIEIIGLRFTHRKSINPSLYGPFFNYFGGGILRYYLQSGRGLCYFYIILGVPNPVLFNFYHNKDSMSKLLSQFNSYLNSTSISIKIYV